MPVAMKRRVYVKITGEDSFTLTGAYCSKEFEVKFEGTTYINPLTLKSYCSLLDLNADKPNPFYVAARRYADGIEVRIYNDCDNKPLLASVASYGDAEKEAHIKTVVIEDE
jgi:hypothetical protein